MIHKQTLHVYFVNVGYTKPYSYSLFQDNQQPSPVPSSCELPSMFGILLCFKRSLKNSTDLFGFLGLSGFVKST